MARKSTVNVYTTLLFMAGIVSAVACVDGFHIPNWPSFIVVFLMTVVLSFFPMRLPSGVSVTDIYGTANMGYMYLLLYLGRNACLAALLIEPILLSLWHGRWQWRSIHWFRVVSSMGIYLICVLAVQGFLHVVPHLALWLRSFGALAVFDGVNLLLLWGLQRSLGIKAQVQAFVGMARNVIVPLFICSAILAVVLRPASPLHLVYECLYSTVILAGIIYITGKHSNIAQLHQGIAKRYQAITDSSSDLIATVTADGRITYASPSHARMLDRVPISLEKLTIHQIVHPADRQVLSDHLHRSFTLRECFTLMIQFLHANGSVVTTEVKATPILDSRGDVSQVVMISRDLTERMKAQETEEMLKRSDQLAMVGQLAAGVAHEVRNPLTSVKGFLKLITRNPEDIQRFSAVIWSEFEHIENIINEFLVWSKPQYGHQTLGDIVQIMKSVTSVMETLAVMRGVEIRMNAADNVPSVLCQENHLKQVFVNVIKNAIESMPDGGLVTVTVSTKNSAVVIEIVDEGCGISKEDLDKIGEPFFTTKEDGTGLGMMVTFKIIHDHRGSIRLNSDGIKGTSVTIELPAATSTAQSVFTQAQIPG